MVKPSNYYDRLHIKHALSTKAAEDNRVDDSQHGTSPKKTGVRRCGRNCKSRGNNQRADAVVHNNFSPAEEELVIKLHATIGSRWSIIAQQIPERSDDDVKNLWNSKLKKKLSAMGIDPITHRPFSQILADYGNIGSNMSKNLAGGGRTRIGYLNKLQDGTINPFISELALEESSSLSQVKLISNDSFSSATAPPNPAYEEEEEEDHSVELLSQLQAIKMVTQVSNYSNTTSIVLEASTSTSCSRLRNECISSSVSSSSLEFPPHQAAVTTNKALGLASPNFSWRDFLSEDTFLPVPAQQEEEQKHLELEEPINNCFAFEQGSTSSASFVQDMIERENQIFSETHGILEDPFYY